MANTKSAIKAARKALRNAARNQAVKTRLKSLAKAVKAAGSDAEKGFRDRRPTGNPRRGEQPAAAELEVEFAVLTGHHHPSPVRRTAPQFGDNPVSGRRR